MWKLRDSGYERNGESASAAAATATVIRRRCSIIILSLRRFLMRAQVHAFAHILVLDSKIVKIESSDAERSAIINGELVWCSGYREIHIGRVLRNHLKLARL